MKFVCDRCQTRYSISDEKVRQKILRIRCKNCGNVIVVQEGGTHGSPRGETGAHEAGRPASASGPKAAPSSRKKGAPSSGPKASPSAHPKADAAMSRGGGPPPPPPPRSGKGPDPMGGHVEWYVAVEGVQSGPFSRVEAAKRVLATPEGQEVHVWKEGMPGWKPPGEVSVIERELSLLRPPPKVPASKTPLPPSSVVHEGSSDELLDEATTVTPPPDLTDQNVPSWSTETTKPGNEEVDLFNEITTQKARDLHEVVGGEKAASFADVTTKKGKNLRDLEAEEGATPPPPVVEADATPPPVEPLPPVGAKVPAQLPAKPSVPVPHKHLPPSASAPQAATRGSVTPRPVTASAPAAASGGVRGPVPASRHAGASVPGRNTTPRPVVDLASPVSQPAGAAGGSPLAPLQTPNIVAVTPPPSASTSGASLPPPMVEFTTPPPLVEFSPQPAGTPQPADVDAFGAGFAPAVSSELEPQLSAPARLFQRRPELKYVVAALAIVVLIILLVLVILRSDREKRDEPPMPVQEEPTKPEPAKVVEEAKAEKPVVAEAPVVVAPVPEPEETVAVNPAPTGRRGGRRSARSGRSRQERVPRSKPDRKPPRLAGARPNPFDEVRAVSQSQITAVVRNPANQAGLKSCYERALKMDNHLTSGRIDVTVSIAASGAVRRVVINAPSSFILVEPCIKSAVKRWVFPASTEEYGTNFPLIMQGGM